MKPVALLLTGSDEKNDSTKKFLAMELRQAAEAVASGESDVNGAVSKKTIAILARSG
ncbi:hypothetical protein FF1_010386 [Malus domestica]